uniref:Alpha-amylase A type-3-like isoform X1 n=1 Tax=Saccoglossus kowalevskii TaxID=10224 RepID=A0ABM0MIG9_SACKO|nr:PREDICTED: alpha-amylase A type-3-like isoform X1 [Saccoglossus kowalevskii]
MDAALNYPLYWAMKDAFIWGGTMRDIANMYRDEKYRFGDGLHLFGNFADNHDQARFLCDKDSWTLLKNYIMLVLTMEGIPIVYYGTEQGYDGCADPNNRESLYPNFDTNHHLYLFIQRTHQFRDLLGANFLNADQIERWQDDSFFAFTRHDMLVCSTNIGDNNNLQRTITYHDYTVGTVLVNIYDENDRVTVDTSGITINLISGEGKIYLPESYMG